MTSKRRTIKHLFGGGFATDYGPAAPIGADSGGTLTLPFLLEAENVFFELDGGPHKIGGTTKLNSSTINSGDEIRGMVDFWRQGTAGAPTQQRVLYSGTKIYADAANGTFSSIKTGLEDDKVPCFTVFNDKLIMSSDSTVDVPMTYDGTNVTNLGGTPPAFSFSCVHKNHLFAAGVASLPSRLYYSKTLDAADWTDTTSGYIDIDPNDGDRITGIASYKDNLWVFKGPYKGSIHRIAGSANTGSDSWSRITFVDKLGAISHNTIFKFGDDLGFMWSDGSIRSLKATSAYGDFNQATLSRPIAQYIKNHVNLTYLHRAWAATYTPNNTVVFCLPIDTGAFPNQILMMDFSRTPVWWAKWPALNACCVASVVDASQSNQPILMIGGRDGYVRKTGAATRSIDGTSNISANVATPFLNYGDASMMKTLAGIAIGISPKGNYTATIGWSRDVFGLQMQTVNQGGGDVLGTSTANQFALNSSTLGGSSYADRYIDTTEGGEFRNVSYRISNNGMNQDLELHSLSATIEIGAESMENL